MQERRSHKRIKVAFPARVRLADRSFDAVSSDISASGVYLAILEPKDRRTRRMEGLDSVDTKVMLEFILPSGLGRINDSVALRCDASIVRIERNARYTGIACRFDRPIRFLSL